MYETLDFNEKISKWVQAGTVWPSVSYPEKDMIGSACAAPAFASRYAGSPTELGVNPSATGVRMLPSRKLLPPAATSSTVLEFGVNTQFAVAPRLLRFTPFVISPRAVS